MAVAVVPRLLVSVIGAWRRQRIEKPWQVLFQAPLTLHDAHASGAPLNEHVGDADLDAGLAHDGGDLRRHVLNLAVARGAAAFLRRRGVRVVMTRDDDRALTLDERIDRARRGGAQILVSVHHDSCPGCCDPLSRRGAGAYYGAQHSEALAEAILSSLEAGGAISRGTRRAGYAVTAPTDFLAVLVECRYLSHPDDEAQILDDGYALRTGGQIGAGVLDFLRRAG